MTRDSVGVDQLESHHAAMHCEPLPFRQMHSPLRVFEISLWVQEALLVLVCGQQKTPPQVLPEERQVLYVLYGEPCTHDQRMDWAQIRV